MAGDRSPIEVFTAAAVEWAAGGRGQPLVDAAAQALVDGLDTPTLRVLAGAPQPPLTRRLVTWPRRCSRNWDYPSLPADRSRR